MERAAEACEAWGQAIRMRERVGHLGPMPSPMQRDVCCWCAETLGVMVLLALLLALVL